MTTPEGKIKNKLDAKLKLLRPDVYVFAPVQMGYGAPSLDRLVCARGRFMAIETKRDAKHDLSPRQVITAETMRQAGATVFLAYDDASIEHCVDTIRKVEWWH